MKKFGFENSYSFHNWVEFDLSAELTREPDDDHLPQPKDPELSQVVRNRVTDGKWGVLPVAAIYGKNASGKTRLLRTLQDVARDALGDSFAAATAFSTLSPYEQIIKNRRFETLEDNLQPLRYFVCVVLKNVEYTLEYTLSSEGITHEKVTQRGLLKKDQPETLYTRDPNGVDGGVDALINKHIELLEGGENVHLWFPSIAQSHPILKNFYEWFRYVRDGITFNDDNRNPQRFEGIAKRIADEGDEPFRKRLLRFLQCLDKSITDIEGEKRKDDSYKLWLYHRRSNAKYKAIADHIGTESDGTLKILEQFPKIDTVLNQGMPFVCDELDRSLHPIAFKQLVRMFNSPKINKNNAQLIFTAHDTYVLDSDFLRRDEVHIINKDAYSVSSITRLSALEHVPAYPNMEYDFRTGIYGSFPVELEDSYE